jgi:hypothetical protein
MTANRTTHPEPVQDATARELLDALDALPEKQRAETVAQLTAFARRLARTRKAPRTPRVRRLVAPATHDGPDFWFGQVQDIEPRPGPTGLNQLVERIARLGGKDAA